MRRTGGSGETRCPNPPPRRHAPSARACGGLRARRARRHARSSARRTSALRRGCRRCSGVRAARQDSVAGIMDEMRCSRSPGFALSGIIHTPIRGMRLCASMIVPFGERWGGALTPASFSFSRMSFQRRLGSSSASTTIPNTRGSDAARCRPRTSLGMDFKVLGQPRFDSILGAAALVCMRPQDVWQNAHRLGLRRSGAAQQIQQLAPVFASGPRCLVRRPHRDPPQSTLRHRCLRRPAQCARAFLQYLSARPRPAQNLRLRPSCG